MQSGHALLFSAPTDARHLNTTGNTPYFYLNFLVFHLKPNISCCHFQLIKAFHLTVDVYGHRMIYLPRLRVCCLNKHVCSPGVKIGLTFRVVCHGCAFCRHRWHSALSGAFMERVVRSRRGDCTKGQNKS